MRSLFHSLHLQMQNIQVCHRNREWEEVQYLESLENQWLWEEYYKQNLTALAEPIKRKNEEESQRLNLLTLQNATHETWRSSYVQASGMTHTYIAGVSNVNLVQFGIRVDSSSTSQRIWNSIEFKSTNAARRMQGLICKTNDVLFCSSLKFCLKELTKYLQGSFLI